METKIISEGEKTWKLLAELKAMLRKEKELRRNAVARVTFFMTSRTHTHPTLRTYGTLGIADPCYIIPSKRWSQFIDAYNKARHGGVMGNQRIVVFVFDGIPFRVMNTGGDGVFKGVAVDSGCLAEFPWLHALAKFGFGMYRSRGNNRPTRKGNLQ